MSATPIRRRVWPTVAAIAALCAFASLTPRRAQAESLEQIEALLAAGDWNQVVLAYEALPPEIAGQFPALYSLAQAQAKIGNLEDAAAIAERAAASAEGEQRALALNHAGRCLAATRKTKHYRRASTAFRQALAADSELAGTRLNLAEVLLLIDDRDAEARDLLTALLADGTPGGIATRAAALLRNPSKADTPSLPSVLMPTIDGEAISDKDLVGEIVLLDFWATWCQPCVESIPSLKRFHEFAEDKPLRLISISVDRSYDLLRDFVEEREMDWAIVHDGERQLARYFGVNRFPTYMLVDSDGFIIDQASGYSPQFGDPVDRLVGRAKSMAKRQKKVSQSKQH